VDPKVAERDIGRQAASRRISGRVRQDDLSTVGSVSL
jgi:hypothetical protein